MSHKISRGQLRHLRKLVLLPQMKKQYEALRKVQYEYFLKRNVWADFTSVGERRVERELNVLLAKIAKLEFA